LSPKWAAPPVQDGIDMSTGTVPPFRERPPWFGGAARVRLSQHSYLQAQDRGRSLFG
jgi:hypothetical protein